MADPVLVQNIAVTGGRFATETGQGQAQQGVTLAARASPRYWRTDTVAQRNSRINFGLDEAIEQLSGGF
jgi:hypothetical protein